jgi:hypothetical protein
MDRKNGGLEIPSYIVRSLLRLNLAAAACHLREQMPRSFDGSDHQSPRALVRANVQLGPWSIPPDGSVIAITVGGGPAFGVAIDRYRLSGHTGRVSGTELARHPPKREV